MNMSMTARAARLYRTVDLDSAPKSQILDRLMQRLIDDVEAAAAAIGRRDLEVKAAKLDHALCIVTELIAALDHAAAPELCGNLGSLYAFVQEQISLASRSLDVRPLRLAAKIVADLREAFRAASAAP